MVSVTAPVSVAAPVSVMTMFICAERPRRLPLWKLSVRFWSLVYEWTVAAEQARALHEVVGRPRAHDDRPQLYPFPVPSVRDQDAARFLLVRIAQQGAGDRRDDLPGQPVLVLEPTALARRSPIARERV